MTPEERRALFLILTVAVLAPLIADRAAKRLRLPVSAYPGVGTSATAGNVSKEKRKTALLGYSDP